MIGLDSAPAPDHGPPRQPRQRDMPKHFVIIEARFYPDIADELLKGAKAELEARGVTYERIDVPGVLEIPAALAMAVKAKGRQRGFDGYVLLGCVIRGETTHYDIVANESARAIMALTTAHTIAVGNGIQTVETEDQAWARARVDGKNKGGKAAIAAYEMAELRAALDLEDE